jgi:signal transduction histidine kinase
VGILQGARETTRRLDLAVAELVRANQAFQDYAQNVERAAALQERRRISRDIHDNVGHTLMNIVMMLEAMLLIAPSDHEKVHRYIRDTREQAGECLRDTRRAVRLLREPDVDYASTSLRLARLANTFAKATGVDVILDLTNTPVELPPQVGVVLYRTLQEGLTNAIRHGKADRIVVYMQRAGGTIILTISDNGRGAGSTNISEGVGLAGMRERVEAMGGRISVGNLAPGFKLSIEVPAAGTGTASTGENRGMR